MKEIVYLVQAPPFWTKTAPLGIEYLRTYLASRRIPVRTIDLNIAAFDLLRPGRHQWLGLDVDLEENLFAQLQNSHPGFFKTFLEEIEPASFVGFSLFGRNSPFSFSLARRVKELFPDKKIVFGGPQALRLSEPERAAIGDYWVVGEGEIPLAAILSGNPQEVYRFQEIKNIDDLDFYDFTATDLSRYSPSLPLLSSRGCPYFCNFCAERRLSSAFRHHSPGYICEQIALLAKKHGSRSFVFLDSLINYDRRWLYEFCELLLKRELTIHWEAQARIDGSFPFDLACLMKRCGCYNLFIGLESGSDATLTRMNKQFTSDDARRFFSTLSKANLHFEVSLIFGYPGETHEDFCASTAFLLANRHIIPKIAQVNPFVDYCGLFPQAAFPTAQALARVDEFIRTAQRQGMKYTKSFINNLIYKHRESMTTTPWNTNQ